MVRTLIYLHGPAPRGGRRPGATDAKRPPKGGDKELSGMSIVGNDDAPKSLVIVPWKSSGLGDTLDVRDVSRRRATARRPGRLHERAGLLPDQGGVTGRGSSGK